MGVKTREQLHELPNEIKAYINQQVAELAPFCLPDSGVAIFVEKEVDNEASAEEYFVTIKLSGGGAEVKSTGQAGNLFEATKMASQTLLEHLTMVQRQMMEELENKERRIERAAEVDEGEDPIVH